jgi:hypothetical protein
MADILNKSEQNLYIDKSKVTLSEYGGSREWDFKSNGMFVAIFANDTDENFIVDHKNIRFKAGDWYANIDFTPNGRTEFKENEMLKTLALGYKAMGDLIERIYEPQKFPVEERLPSNIRLIVGTTNRRMGEMATRLGFRLTDESRLGAQEDKLKVDKVTVLARPQDIKIAYEKFRNSTVGEKIVSRALKEKVVD